jgi:glutaredoxin
MGEGYTILTRDGCDYCTLAKTMLPNALVLQSPEIHQLVKSQFGTFPQIFHKGKHIGGYTDLLAYRPE